MDSHDKDFKVYDKKDFKNPNDKNANSRDKWKNRDVFSSLNFALTGILTAFRYERNMRKHALSAIVAIAFGIFFKISEFEWLFLLLSIFLVFMAELFNSAIENVVDLASDYQFHMRAKRAKDMAAGAVLVISGFAIVVGLIVFLPKIWSLIFK
ncbi:diacylglycerol kinase family protein [Lactococcus protaetiae]|uniref:Diacylglycerol kinase family protein n=1 Tax=Lactococcus protaetiae TaxID=2592653 RepID=A0A514Z9C8_9LACT|nr:diacylglycerol kinase family protein [Lactococcus protaetiae]MCL2113461.1 diacylglycerol kinase family protein [Streptococcaceae bacterium]QDK71196.1 diacylglycerol kinase family protein [Lactococcus protaetiae]